jgi:hypothetical protein
MISPAAGPDHPTTGDQHHDNPIRHWLSSMGKPPPVLMQEVMAIAAREGCVQRNLAPFPWQRTGR